MKFGNSRGKVRRTNLSVESLEVRDVPAVFATATPPGSTAVVTIHDVATWSTVATVSPFSGFTGGVQTAIADANGDGTDDVIVAAGVGSAPLLAMYSGTDGSLIRTLNVGDASSLNGASVAAVGKDTSGNVLLAVGSVLNGTATVQVIKASDGTVVSKFKPFGEFTGSLSLASADVNADGVADIVVGAGAGGGPRLTCFNGVTGAVIYDGFVFEDYFNGGINVSEGDLNSDGKPDIVVGAGKLGGPRVRVLETSTWQSFQDFFAYDSAQRDGVQASVFTATAGGTAALITTDGSGRSDPIKAFDGATLASVATPNLPGLPDGPPMTMTAPTYKGTIDTPDTPAAGDSGMVDSIPDVNSASWQAQDDGLKIWDVQTGTGDAVTASSHLEVYYTGWLLNGTKFDSARSPSSPASFALTGLIQGWQEGLLGMKPGGIRRLYIPAALAYGASATGSIPANSDLVFELKLVAVS